MLLLPHELMTQRIWEALDMITASVTVGLKSSVSGHHQPSHLCSQGFCPSCLQHLRVTLHCPRRGFCCAVFLSNQHSLHFVDWTQRGSFPFIYLQIPAIYFYFSSEHVRIIALNSIWYMVAERLRNPIPSYTKYHPVSCFNLPFFPQVTAHQIFLFVVT